MNTALTDSAEQAGEAAKKRGKKPLMALLMHKIIC